METADLIRYSLFLIFGSGVAIMIMTNIVAYLTLRVPHRVGFLWWHVSSISVSFFLIGLVALESVIVRFGTATVWQTPVLLLGLLLFLTAQVIIFRVERARYFHQRALIQGAAEEGYGGVIGER